MKIGVCGLVCDKCPAFASKKCPGCHPSPHCPLPACAKKKKVKFCFECKDFPCEKNYKGGPLVKELLDFHKENKK